MIQRTMDSLSIPYAICLLSLLTICVCANGNSNLFNVLSYGASGDGTTDDSSAFMKAWSDTCKATSNPTLVIPQGKQFLVHPMIFTGPCKSTTIQVQLSGTILAPDGPGQWKATDLSTWLAFQGVDGLRVNGKGSMDGRGKGWWDKSCKYHPGQGCVTLAPTTLKFQKCNDIKMRDISFHNSPQTHVLLLGCQNVDFGFLNIQSPGTSPNTDGIHLQFASNVSIHDSQIGDGDDCISIGDKTFNINITDIDCGPGHGISIGSLGSGGMPAQVENINVMRVNFRGTTNGARIKTWQTGQGIVQGVTFSNLNFTAVENPIIIDQYYCYRPNACKETKTGVRIKDISYSGLMGTSKTEVAINLNCSNVVPCTGITLDNIRLAPATNEIGQLTSSCNNAYGVNRGTIQPKSCVRSDEQCLMQERLVFTIFVTVLHILTPGVSSTSNSFNVMNYGAVGDGRADDSAVFLKAWEAACKAPSRNPSLIIPDKKIFLLKPVTFSGPCKSTSIYVLVSGDIVAPNSKMAWKGFHINIWLVFTNVNGLNIIGSGTINGRGHAWWPNPCLHKVPTGVTCKGPTALTFYGCNRLVLKGIRHINSQRNHITISNCNDVTVSNLHISAPRTSPNTDGIDISSSTNIRIRDSFIGTGDDCVAVSAGSSRINVTGIACGPGHGISIGSLGAGENDKVEEVQVRNCTFKGTMTGVRIKTWQGNVGYARKISFEKIRFIRADNSIIIDQYYCPERVNCKNETSGIKISDVTYSSIIGTSITDKVINLSCDQNVGCSNIQFRHVYIQSTVPGKKAYSATFNARGNYTHTRPVVTGLLP
ncbi:hypothetical protein like AT3G15720 [Hibiscus trionum]|uniref:endo-polygalacturonase n=1 Tax=Hibiscus trionum TaxID=183268 RepID=A0A9W7IEU5_HIBTR|nr:hypothetical protein like AT3G15720 [Hibiscus trionum]GMI93888.1 hypothetical protein like AT3G15720 [Hibiscus trionum]GMI93890.1 hypothetical protein like AT3G15720 [Hibiscus trionum]GMI93892.1 hypothetical protein like AT3G15720 [Hibiscus trionum]